MPSKIEWTDETWNPIVGCTKCSPGCLNCYAEKMSARLANMMIPGYCDGVVKLDEKRDSYLPKWTGEIIMLPAVLDQPLHWRKPRRIFVCSMSDLFHPKVPPMFRCRIWDMAAVCPQHTFLWLTKRIRNAQEWYKWLLEKWQGQKILSNIHLGVSISNQAEMWKATELSRIPAAVRFISFEPLLEDVGEIPLTSCREDDNDLEEFGQHIDWVVVGGESGPKRRPCNTEWVRSIVEQCKAANVPVFVKQINVNGKVVKMPKDLPQEYPE